MAAPSRIPTSRLTLRCWNPHDAPQLRESILSSLPELQASITWASREPLPMAETAQRLADMQRDFLAERCWAYGIFDLGESMVVGGLRLQRSPGDAGAREMSYWIRTSCTGRGYATEAVCAATAHAFADDCVERIVIRCHCQNKRGAAIPQRLGYTLAGMAPTEERPALGSAVQEAMIWELTRSSFRRMAELPARSQVWLS